MWRKFHYYRITYCRQHGIKAFNPQASLVSPEPILTSATWRQINIVLYHIQGTASFLWSTIAPANAGLKRIIKTIHTCLYKALKTTTSRQQQAWWGWSSTSLYKLRRTNSSRMYYWCLLLPKQISKDIHPLQIILLWVYTSWMIFHSSQNKPRKTSKNQYSTR